MKTSEASLLRMLSGKKQFVVPLYPRAYAWDPGPVAASGTT